MPTINGEIVWSIFWIWFITIILSGVISGMITKYALHQLVILLDPPNSPVGYLCRCKFINSNKLELLHIIGEDDNYYYHDSRCAGKATISKDILKIEKIFPK